MMTDEEIIAVVTAHKEGKTIQVSSPFWTSFTTSREWTDINVPSWDFHKFDYRVKPEPKVRPYTFEEFKKAVISKGMFLMPKYGDVYSISYFCDNLVSVGSLSTLVTYDSLLKDYTWLDGSPCGVEEK